MLTQQHQTIGQAVSEQLLFHSDFFDFFSLGLLAGLVSDLDSDLVSDLLESLLAGFSAAAAFL